MPAGKAVGLPADLLKRAMDAEGLDDNDARAALVAICMGESKMVGHSETGYSHTSNDRIRVVFGSRVSGLSDAQLDELKVSDERWFNFIYSPHNHVGQMLGNTSDGDGYAFRGRGFIQLTGRGNYTKYGQEIGHPEIVTNPDLANDPAIAAQLAVAYILDRWDGQDFDSMVRCVGTCTPDIYATKKAYYEQFLASGEFNTQAVPPEPAATSAEARPDPATQPEPDPGIVANIIAGVERLVSPESLVERL